MKKLKNNLKTKNIKQIEKHEIKKLIKKKKNMKKNKKNENRQPKKLYTIAPPPSFPQSLN